MAGIDKIKNYKIYSSNSRCLYRWFWYKRWLGLGFNFKSMKHFQNTQNAERCINNKELIKAQDIKDTCQQNDDWSIDIPKQYPIVHESSFIRLFVINRILWVVNDAEISIPQLVMTIKDNKQKQMD